MSPIRGAVAQQGDRNPPILQRFLSQNLELQNAHEKLAIFQGKNQQIHIRNRTSGPLPLNQLRLSDSAARTQAYLNLSSSRPPAFPKTLHILPIAWV